MTLIMQATVAKSDKLIPYPFVVVTTDTRTITRRLYLNNFEFDETILKSRDDSCNKVNRISDNVLICRGGTADASEPMQDFIIGKADKSYYLEDFESIVKDGYKHLKETGDDVIKHFIDTDSVFISLVGFYKNGTPGTVKLGLNGEIEKTEVSPDMNGYNVFSPTKDIAERQDELLNFGESPFLPLLSQGGNAVDVYFNHLLMVHSIVASQEVETISGTCLVHILVKGDNETNYECHEVDLTEQIKQIQQQHQEAT